jgi:hypothetical protein
MVKLDVGMLVKLAATQMRSRGLLRLTKTVKRWAVRKSCRSAVNGAGVAQSAQDAQRGVRVLCHSNKTYTYAQTTLLPPLVVSAPGEEPRGSFL